MKKELLQFSTSWCGPCKAARKFITSNWSDLNYRFIDLESTEDQEILSFASRLNVRSVPVFALVEGEKIIKSFKGFSPQEIMALIENNRDSLFNVQEEFDIKKHKYRPLPEELTIKKSKIHGIGLFTKEEIGGMTNFGISHILKDDSLVRTPLGGFINHSFDPNCELKQEDDLFFLISKDGIKKNQELTIDYRTNKCGDDYTCLQNKTRLVKVM